MYNKKYRIEKIEQFGNHNPIYEDMDGCLCYPVYFNAGERGWFLYDDGYMGSLLHRVHTSIVEKVEYTRDNRIIVTTQNTRLTFKVEDPEKLGE